MMYILYIFYFTKVYIQYIFQGRLKKEKPIRIVS